MANVLKTFEGGVPPSRDVSRRYLAGLLLLVRSYNNLRSIMACDYGNDFKKQVHKRNKVSTEMETEKYRFFRGPFGRSM